MQQTNPTVLTPSRDSSGAVLAALKAAFPQTIPVLTGYFVLGLGYGIYVQSLGLPIWLPPLMGTWYTAEAWNLCWPPCCWAAFRPSLPF